MLSSNNWPHVLSVMEGLGKNIVCWEKLKQKNEGGNVRKHLWNSSLEILFVFSQGDYCAKQLLTSYFKIYSTLYKYIYIYIYIYITYTLKSMWQTSRFFFFISHPKSIIFNETI